MEEKIQRLMEMVSAAYTAGWLAGYNTGETLDDESETNLRWDCKEDWLKEDLRSELLSILKALPLVQPVVVCLCGSTRFSQAFRDANLHETLKGKIVLSIGCDMRSDDYIFGGLQEDEVVRIKSELDTLHLRKIDLADEVLILNVGGYIGQSTRRELNYAIEQGKTVRYLEKENTL